MTSGATNGASLADGKSRSNRNYARIVKKSGGKSS